jgi:biopolymer transport protein ExbD
MLSINNPKNVTGMAGLLSDDNEEEMIDLDEIEASITQGFGMKKREQPNIDYAKEYTKDLEDIGKKFNLPSASNSMYTKLDLDTISLKSDTSSKKSFKINLDDDEKYYPRKEAVPNWTMDKQIARMTVEEKKQTHINSVLNNIDTNNDDADFVIAADEEDEMARMLEQIDLLKTNLSNEGIELSKVPDVGINSSKKEIKNVLKILQIKNDRLRYCDFFEEGILAFAYGLETIFNGDREFFGNKIDLTGYSDTVKVKLRRMRYDTSNFVSGIVQSHNISSGWRIILELIPSLFLYSRDRRLKAKDNLISDDAYKRAMQDLM